MRPRLKTRNNEELKLRVELCGKQKFYLYSDPSLPSTVCISTPYISRFFALFRNESSACAGVWFLEYNCVSIMGIRLRVIYYIPSNLNIKSIFNI